MVWIRNGPRKKEADAVRHGQHSAGRKDMVTDMILAEKIITLRKRMNWSQEELAEKLDISRQAVSKWEAGSSSPDIHNIVQLGKLYGISTDSILLDKAPSAEDTDRSSEAANGAPQNEETPVHDGHPANGFLWAVLGTVIVLVLYFVTNLF